MWIITEHVRGTTLSLASRLAMTKGLIVKTELDCPEFWYGQGHNSGEKERPSCMF